MKPTKNRVFCNAIKRHKMLFPTKEKADNFIKFNAEEIARQRQVAPIRSYYCTSCAGWHVTHKPDCEAYTRKDELNEILYNLEKLITALKTTYKNEDYMIWQPKLEEAKVWVESLSEDCQYHNFLFEAKRQLTHYHAEVTRAVDKQRMSVKKFNKSLNCAMNGIRSCLAQRDIQGCFPFAHQMRELTNHPMFSTLVQEDREAYTLLAENLTNKDITEKLVYIADLCKSLDGQTTYMNTEDLKWVTNLLSIKFDELLQQHKIKGTVSEPFKRVLQKLQKKVRQRGDNYKDEKTGLDRAELALLKHYELCHEKLEEVQKALDENDNIIALSILRSIDDRIKAIPLTKEKTQILQRFTALAGCVL